VRVAEAGIANDTVFGRDRLDSLFRDLSSEEGVAVALSGGADSTALLHLLLAWRATSDLKLRIVALTVDHGLRPESAGEAIAVAKACSALGVEHHTLTWLTQQNEKPATGIQAKARVARYGLMTAWCRDHAINTLMTAHTADDQAETVLMRARRTNSPESLAAIWPENEWNGVRLLRPLLDVRRSALRQHLREHGVDWIEDPSNSNRRFERVRVRQELGAADVPQLATAARKAQERARMVTAEARLFAAQHLSADIPGALAMPLAAFQAQAEEVKLAILRFVLCRFQLAHRPERAELERLAAWIESETGTRRSLGGLLFARRRQALLVGREPGRIAPEWMALPASGAMVWDNRFHVMGPAGLRVGPVILDRTLQRPRGLPHWLWQGLPAVKLPDGEVRCAATITQKLWGKGTDRPVNLLRNEVLEQLGIRATATYVSSNQVIGRD
jgi:tRNA(Ile)-lysidine synthase